MIQSINAADAGNCQKNDDSEVMMIIIMMMMMRIEFDSGVIDRLDLINSPSVLK